MKIDSPPEPTLPLTLQASINYVRSYGVQMCQDNGIDEVEFDFAPRGLWSIPFKVSSEGFVEANVEMKNEMEQVKEMH